MTEGQTAARGQRAKAALDEFVGPALANMRKEYADRIVQIAASELDSKTRADKLTALSLAMRVVDNLDSGIRAAIEDGKMAEVNMAKADRIERMTPGKRRLLDFTPY